MINNISVIENKYKCKRNIMKYLVYKCQLPVLGLDGDSYYFAKTERLDAALKKMPWHLKLLAGLAK